MRRLSFITVCLMMVVQLLADTVTVDQARQKASKFLNGRVVARARGSAPPSEELKMSAIGKDNSYYIFNVGDNEGFVVVSGEDATEEILGYSDTGSIDPEFMPCGMRMLFDNYADQIRFLRENGITREQNISMQKTEVSSFRIARRSYFDQCSPYNDALPDKGDDAFPDGLKGYPSGCVAMAMAGLMYAHKWPNSTTAAIPGYWWLEKLHYWELSGFPSNYKIDWDNILPSYKEYGDNKKDEKTQAIAKLSFLCGVSIKTEYEKDGSGADTEDVAYALKNYFGYDESVKYVKRKDYNAEEWKNMLREEIINRGPVVYSGKVSWDNLFTNPDGHAFLLDGFEGDKFYINFGWGEGSSEKTLFLIDLINVVDKYRYPYNQEAILNVCPIPHVELEVTDLKLDNANLADHTFTEETLEGSITFHNKGEGQSVKFIYLRLHDVETGKKSQRIIPVIMSKDEYYAYRFSFSNLTIGHHYVLSAFDLFGDEFYHSEEQHCVEDAAFVENEVETGIENVDGYEYWFDEDFADRKMVSMNSNSAVIRNSIETDHLENGVHRFNLRFHRSDNTYSSITSSPFLKLTKEKEGHLDYWVDDDKDNIASLSLEDTEEEQSLSLDLSALPTGYHRVNIQVATSGTAKGIVYSQGVMKLATGKADELEYWFDNKFNDRKWLTGKRALSDDGYTINADLDLTGLEPGHHRLSFRPISESGLTSGSVCEVPVILYSRYNYDVSDGQITSYSVTVDNGEPQLIDLQRPAQEVVVPYVFDARKLSEGDHTVKTEFWNSYGLSTSDEATFKVVASQTPAITLKATEQNGLVSLSFNSIPNDVSHRIFRVDGNGVKAAIAGKSIGSYPTNVTYEDNPAAGTYTYHAESIYLDKDGKSQRVSSNEVTVSVSKPQSEEVAESQYGYVTGRIVCDQNTPTYGLKVAFSDGVTISADNASFLRTRVPVGRSLTLTVNGDETHSYQPYTLSSVKAGVNYVILNGTQIEGYQPDNLANDLCFHSSLEWTTQGGEKCVKFKVKNLSPTKTWQGMIRLKAIDKNMADKKNYDLAVLPYSNKNFQNCYSADFTFEPSAEGEVTTPVEKLSGSEDAEYYLFFESVGKWKDSDMDKETKPLAVNSLAGMANNPITKTIEKTVQVAERWDEKSMQKLANLIVRLSSLNNGLADKTGDLSRYRNDMVKMAKDVTGQTDESKAINTLMDLLDSKSLNEIVNDPKLASGVSLLFDISSDLIGKMPEVYWNGLMRKIVNAADAKFLLNEFVQVVKGVTGKDELERAFACANLLYANIANAASASGSANPYSALMYAYMVVGRSLSKKVLELGEVLHDGYLSERLYQNHPFTGEQSGKNKNKYNTTCDFKIVVKNGKKTIDFTSVDMNRQVKSVCIKASNSESQGVAVIPFTCKFLKDGIMLVSQGRESIANAGGISANLGTNLKEFYMEIEWNNERTTKIPLIEKTDGIDIHVGQRFEGLTGYENNLDQSVYTITLTTASGTAHIGDELYLGTNKNRK